MGKSSKESESNGVLARLIENWLTSTPERGFEIPFAHLLISRGYKIVHIESHSVTEMGKDVVAISPTGVPCGYQLKQGNISATRWDSEVQREMGTLCELAATQPPVKGKLLKPFLVTTGELSSNAHLRVNAYNDGLEARELPFKLEVIEFNELSSWFREAFGQVLPLQPFNTKRLFEFYLSDGGLNLDCEKFALLLGDFPDMDGQQPGQMRRHIGSLPLLSAYAISPQVAKGNHWAQALAWTLTASQIVKLANKYGIVEKDWIKSFVLCKDAAYASLVSLFNEAIGARHLISGSAEGEGGECYRVRATLLCGIVSATCLIAKVREESSHEEMYDKASEFIAKYRGLMNICGEVHGAMWWLVYVLMRQRGGTAWAAEDMLFQYMYNVLYANAKKSPINLPPPYIDAETCLLRMYERRAENPLMDETYSGRSYTVRPIIYELARMMRRGYLGVAWDDIVSIQMAEMDFPDKDLYLEFHAARGTYRTSFFPRPTSWSWLRRESARMVAVAPRRIPKILVDDPEFMLLYVLAYPHRVDDYVSAQLRSQH